MNKGDDFPTRVHTAARKLRDEAQDKTRAQSRSPTEMKTRVHSRVEESERTRVAPDRNQQSQASSVKNDATRIANASLRKRKPMPALRPGSLIRNRFRLEKKIGEGGMGVVYTARDLRKEEVGDKDSRIAIKLLSEDFQRHPESLQMLQQETRKAQKLAHPNVVTVYDFDRDGDTVFMTMEYLSGIPLDEYLEKHRLDLPDVKDVLPIITDIVNGLDYAHAQGVVHSDLKPGNIFYTEEGVAKILDFGIARAIMDGGSTGKSSAYSGESAVGNSDDLNTNALFALTPGYASLEMFEGAPPDPRDDLFALACITYKLLCGKHPFGNLPANEIYERGLSPARIEGLNDRQWKTLSRGLELEKENRIGSAKEFLEGFLPKRKEPWKYIAAAVAVITVLSTTYFMLRSPPEVALTEQEQLLVEEELVVARESFEVGALGIAFNNYKMILALPPYDKQPPGQGFVQQPYNREAMSGINQLLDEFEKQAKIAINEGRFVDAEGFVEAGISIPDEKKRFEILKKKLTELQ